MKNAVCRLWGMYENSNMARVDERIESGRLLKELSDQKNKAEKKYEDLMKDVNQFMDSTERQVHHDNYQKMQEKEEADNQQMQQQNHLIDAMKNEVEVYKKGMADMKQLLSTQAEVFKNKKQQILQERDALKLERDALVQERDALKEEKKKIEYALFDLIQAGDVNKDKMKKIQQIIQE
jgi:hypothetical protein